MVRYYKRRHFIKVKISWFGYQYNFWDLFSFNAIMHLKGYENKKAPGIPMNSHTLELSLEKDTEVIFSNFSKQIRQQTKIAEQEGIKCYFHENVNSFVEFFNDFAARKNTYSTSLERVEEMGGNLKLSFAEYNGQVLAAHSYLIDKELGIVRHFHSATKRLDETNDRNLVGRANKYLTVHNIVAFKDSGYKLFDFGGYAEGTQDESLAGINKYKLLFGGKVVPCANYYSYSYWLIKKIGNLFGSRGDV